MNQTSLESSLFHLPEQLEGPCRLKSAALGNCRPRSSPDRHLDVFAFQHSGSDLNVYIVNALSTGNGRLKHDWHDQQKQRFIDKDHLFMTEDREAEMRLQG